MAAREVLFRREETGVGSVGAYAEGYLSHTSRAMPVVGGALVVSIDARVRAAAVKVNADPRPASKRAVLVRLTERVFDTLNVKVIWGLLFHAQFIGWQAPASQGAR